MFRWVRRQGHPGVISSQSNVCGVRYNSREKLQFGCVEKQWHMSQPLNVFPFCTCRIVFSAEKQHGLYHFQSALSTRKSLYLHCWIWVTLTNIMSQASASIARAHRSAAVHFALTWPGRSHWPGHDCLEVRQMVAGSFH